MKTLQNAMCIIILSLLTMYEYAVAENVVVTGTTVIIVNGTKVVSADNLFFSPGPLWPTAE